MNATSKNEKIARTIINVLAENECTTKEASEILSFVERSIYDSAVVRKANEKLLEV